MAASYNLKVVADFASAHTLRDYPGACARMHGHNWKVEVEIETQELNEVGMGIDFRMIRNAAREIGDRLDHRYLNDLEPFQEVNPTAENIAAYFYRELRQNLDRPKLKVKSVTLWETDRACVRYSEEQ